MSDQQSEQQQGDQAPVEGDQAPVEGDEQAQQQGGNQGTDAQQQGDQGTQGQ